jgi:YYY domain-containing protein
LLTFKPPVLADQGLPLGLVAQRSYLNQFLQFWGIQLLLAAPALVAILARGAKVRDASLAGGALVVFVGFADRLGSGALAVCLVYALAAAEGARRALSLPTPGVRDDQVASRRPLAFALGAISLGALLLAACEVVHIRDFYGGALSRMNTVFKLYYQAWLLLALGGAGAAYWLLRTLRPRRAPAPIQRGRWGYVALGTLLVFAGLHFPWRVTQLRTEGFGTEATLHGMAWMQRFHPEDFAAAEWLRVQGASPAQRTPVILEATGGAYSEFSRMATQTGFPTILGWDQHERLWRGSTIEGEVAQRKADVDAAYGAATFEQAKPVLDKYGVAYVVVGYLEQQKYGAGGGLAKFQSATGLERVFSQGQTAIYRVRR